jgi:hypothetical protein
MVPIHTDLPFSWYVLKYLKESRHHEVLHRTSYSECIFVGIISIFIAESCLLPVEVHSVNLSVVE